MKSFIKTCILKFNEFFTDTIYTLGEWIWVVIAVVALAVTLIFSYDTFVGIVIAISLALLVAIVSTAASLLAFGVLYVIIRLIGKAYTKTVKWAEND